MDARGRVDLTSFAPIVETHLANTVLTNGARLYVDHAHPEYSSPECRTPLEATLYDVAGEEVMRRALEIANETLDPDQAITLYKNNSDGKGNSYGTHENYLVQRDLEFAHLIRAMVPHFVSRQIIVGAGKVGAETEPALESNPTFQLSQRAEFFEEVVGLETTLKRPIINTRDEPHSDAERFRRLHVIIGDANMSQVATFVKLGSTALLLAALEEFGPEPFPAMPRSPVHAVRGLLTRPDAERVGPVRGRAVAHRLGLPRRALGSSPARYVERTARERRRRSRRGASHPQSVARDARWRARRPRHGRRPGRLGGQIARRERF